jgi:PAS domain S-box-containing protein
LTTTNAFVDDANAGTPPQVLLIDDDEVNLLLTALALRERGFNITEAASGEDALAMLSDWAPDIIVLDAMMPVLDGFATCARLRRMPGFENVPVLMLTGLDDDASITRAYQAGATDFFVKATQWSLLAGRLRYLLRASRTRQELERSKSKLARAQDLARMGSFEWRPVEKLASGELDLSLEALRVFGIGSDGALNLGGLLRMVHRDDRRGLLRMLVEVRDHNSVLATDLPVTLADGRVRIVHVEAEPEFNEQGQGTGYTGIVQDVTDRRTAEDKIRHLANFDALTGLPNRRQLIWRTERALEHARRLGHQCALLLIDLDRFKIINDTLGHAAGATATRCSKARSRPSAHAPTARWRPWAGWAATSSWRCCPKWLTTATPSVWPAASSKPCATLSSLAGKSVLSPPAWASRCSRATGTRCWS